MGYIHDTFMPQSLSAAKQVALSADPANPHKFTEETQFLVDFLRAHNLVTRDSAVLDFGCGMGRVSRALIDAFECAVEGTDYSEPMRRFAHEYVASPRFVLRETPQTLSDVAIAAFVLQHVEYPEAEVERIAAHVRPGGVLVLVNEHKRFVPSAVDAQGYVVWQDDSVDIRAMLSEYFVHQGDHDYYGRSDKPLSVWVRRA